MRVGQRLFLAVVPAIVGLLAVASLAYWGKYARQAPEWVVVAAIVASIGSAILAWRNTRYVAQRVEQLAARREGRSETSGSFRRASAMVGMALNPHPSPSQSGDELDRIEALVDRLTDALAASRTALVAQGELIAERRREYERLVAASVEDSMRQLEEVRLPLHILLENHFGELNENQEEMLGAARSASESVDAALLRLRDVVQLDLGAVTLREERVRLADVMSTILPPIALAAGDREIVVHSDLPPTIPTLVADRGKLQEALQLLLMEQLHTVADGGAMVVSAEHDARGVRVSVRGGALRSPTPAMALATRLVRAHGGRVEGGAAELMIHLPVPPPALSPPVKAPSNDALQR